jgi:hypothetical protein
MTVLNIQRNSLTLTHAVMQVKKFISSSVEGGNVSKRLCSQAVPYCTELITVLSSQSNLFQCLPKLHPSVIKKQKHWEAVELMWLEFMSDFTFHAEGQLAVPKVQWNHLDPCCWTSAACILTVTSSHT